MLTSLLRCRIGSSAYRHLATTNISAGPSSRRTFSQSNLLRLPRPSRSIGNNTSGEIPSFREMVRGSRLNEAFSEKVGKPGIRNQLLFVGFTSLFAFSYAASRTNIETEYWKKKYKEANGNWMFKGITSKDLKQIQNVEFIRKLREWFTDINVKMQELPGLIRPWVGLAFVSVLQPFADASEGKRLCWKICLLNTGVYLCWKILRLRPAMNTRFMHNPLSGLSYTLLTSMFSHKSFVHLLFNCLALESFGSAAYYHLMQEQGKVSPPILESTGAFHFLAFFISAGMFSGLVSHVVSAKIMYPRLISKFAAASRATPKTDTWAAAVAATAKSPNVAANVAKDSVPKILPSLGASGAIYATLTMTALAFPESQVALFIPPSYPISIETAVGGLVALDMIGVLRGWRMFDHWAHLGGAAFGVFYYAYGSNFWNSMRRTFQIDHESIPRS